MLSGSGRVSGGLYWRYANRIANSRYTFDGETVTLRQVRALTSCTAARKGSTNVVADCEPERSSGTVCPEFR